MAAHSIGSATVSFGLVSVPVQLFAAGESKAAISFNWLHKKEGARLKQQYVCSKDGEKVERSDMMKGYEFQKGQYVTFTPDELKALEERATGAIDVVEFLPAEQVDRIYLDRTYFLGPDKGGERAYKLLAEAMEQIERKVEGKQITEEPEEAPKTKVLDLMQALKQSLETAPGEEKEKPAKRRKVAGKR